MACGDSSYSNRTPDPHNNKSLRTFEVDFVSLSFHFRPPSLQSTIPIFSLFQLPLINSSFYFNLGFLSSIFNVFPVTHFESSIVLLSDGCLFYFLFFPFRRVSLFCQLPRWICNESPFLNCFIAQISYFCGIFWHDPVLLVFALSSALFLSRLLFRDHFLVFRVLINFSFCIHCSLAWEIG